MESSLFVSDLFEMLNRSWRCLKRQTEVGNDTSEVSNVS
jgi:hypothetical protein